MTIADYNMTSIAMYSIIFHLTNRRVGTVNCCQLNFSSLLYNIQQLPSQNQLFFPYCKTITFQQCGVYFRQTCTMIESGSATLHYGEKCENLKHISMYCETCELKKIQDSVYSRYFTSFYTAFYIGLFPQHFDL